MTTGEAIPVDALFAAGLPTGKDSLAPQLDVGKLFNSVDNLTRHNAVCSVLASGADHTLAVWIANLTFDVTSGDKAFHATRPMVPATT